MCLVLTCWYHQPETGRFVEFNIKMKKLEVCYGNFSQNDHLRRLVNIMKIIEQLKNVEMKICFVFHFLVSKPSALIFEMLIFELLNYMVAYLISSM